MSNNRDTGNKKSSSARNNQDDKTSGTPPISSIYKRKLTLVRVDPESRSLIKRRGRPIDKALCSIGRSEGCDITIKRDGVGDPLHAVLTCGGPYHPGCTLQNMAMPPCAPVQVNDHAITGSISLRHGDVIGICGRLFLYEEELALVPKKNDAEDPSDAEPSQQEKTRIDETREASKITVTQFLSQTQADDQRHQIPMLRKFDSQAISSPPPPDESQVPMEVDEDNNDGNSDDSAPTPPPPDGESLQLDFEAASSDRNDGIKRTYTPPTEAGSPVDSHEGQPEKKVPRQLFDDGILEKCEKAVADVNSGITGLDAPSLSVVTDESSMIRGNSNAWMDAIEKRTDSAEKKISHTSDRSSSKKKHKDKRNSRKKKSNHKRKRKHHSDDDDDDYDISGNDDYDDEYDSSSLEEDYDSDDDDDTWTQRQTSQSKKTSKKRLLLEVEEIPLFQGFKFILTCVADKETLQNKLIEKGGSIEVIGSRSPRPPSFESWNPFPKFLLLTEPDKFGGLVTTPTCLLFLLNGVPCIDRKWVDDCIASKRVRNPRDYLLPVKLDVSDLKDTDFGSDLVVEQTDSGSFITIAQPIKCSSFGGSFKKEGLLLDQMEFQLHVHDIAGNRIPLISVEQSFLRTWELILDILGSRIVKESRVHYDMNLHIVRSNMSFQRQLLPSHSRSSRRQPLFPSKTDNLGVIVNIPDVSAKWLSYSLLLDKRLPYSSFLYKSSSSKTPAPSHVVDPSSRTRGKSRKTANKTSPAEPVGENKDELTMKSKEASQTSCASSKPSESDIVLPNGAPETTETSSSASINETPVDCAPEPYVDNTCAEMTGEVQEAADVNNGAALNEPTTEKRTDELNVMEVEEIVSTDKNEGLDGKATSQNPSDADETDGKGVTDSNTQTIN